MLCLPPRKAGIFGVSTRYLITTRIVNNITNLTALMDHTATNVI